MLDALGIGQVDEAVYRSLLAAPGLSGVEMARRLGISQGQVRPALRRLRDLGLVRKEGARRYQPIGPRTVLTDLLAKQRAEAESAFASIQDTVEDLAESYRAGRLMGDPRGVIEVVTDEATIVQRVHELDDAVRSSYWILERPPYLWSVSNADEEASTKSLLCRGISLRSVYSAESFDRPGRFELVTRLAELGEQARMLPSLPFKLRIVDRRIAMLPLIPDRYDSIAVIRSSGLLDALIELFEAYWQRAQPMASSCGSEDQPRNQDLVLLRMLHAGYKDQAIARQMGLSARTATRRIAEIAARLGVETRFQVGAEAARRGWI